MLSSVGGATACGRDRFCASFCGDRLDGRVLRDLPACLCDGGRRVATAVIGRRRSGLQCNRGDGDIGFGGGVAVARWPAAAAAAATPEALAGHPCARWP